LWDNGSPIPPTFPSPDGLEITVDETTGIVQGEVRVSDAIRGAPGHVHNGVLASMAVSLASRGTSRGLANSGRVGIATSIDMYCIDLPHPLRLVGEAKVRHRGPTEWIWDIDITDEGGRLYGMGRVTVVVRPGEPLVPEAE
jgi:1,4-dihydroxy-2-naphthoyl-CoA hydrolase